MSDDLDNPEIVPVDPRYEHFAGKMLEAAQQTPEQIQSGMMEGAAEAATGLIKATQPGQEGMSSAIKNRAMERVQSNLAILNAQKTMQAQRKKLMLMQGSFQQKVGALKNSIDARHRLIVAENLRNEARSQVLRGVIVGGATIAGAAIGGGVGGAAAGAAAGSLAAQQAVPSEQVSNDPNLQASAEEKKHNISLHGNAVSTPGPWYY